MAKLIEIDYEPSPFNDELPDAKPGTGQSVRTAHATAPKLVPVDYEPEPYEGGLPAPSGFLRRAVADTGVSLAKGVVGLGEAAVGLADIPTLGHAGKALEEYAGYDPGRTQQFLEGLYSPEQQAANRAVGEAWMRG